MLAVAHKIMAVNELIQTVVGATLRWYHRRDVT